MKIFEKSRKRNHTETLEQKERGFRTERSTEDNELTTEQIIEKLYRQGKAISYILQAWIMLLDRIKFQNILINRGISCKAIITAGKQNS